MHTLMNGYTRVSQRLLESRRLRASLYSWLAVGFVVTVGLTFVVALCAAEQPSFIMPVAVMWWILVSAAYVAGVPLLITDSGVPLQHYGIPNGLTATRAWACFPLFLCAALSFSGRLNLLLWFALGATVGLLDAVDGIVARRIGPISRFGKAFDPAVDAIFFSVGVLGSYMLHFAPLWIAVLVCIRYLVPFVATPVVFLTHRRPEVVRTPWGRRSTIAVGAVLFILFITYVIDGSVDAVALIVGVPLLVPTTALHFLSLWERVQASPTR